MGREVAVAVVQVDAGPVGEQIEVPVEVEVRQTEDRPGGLRDHVLHEPERRRLGASCPCGEQPDRENTAELGGTDAHVETPAGRSPQPAFRPRLAAQARLWRRPVVAER